MAKKPSDLASVAVIGDADASNNLSDHQVSMSNAIIRAAQSLTLVEKRLMAAAVAGLNSLRRPWTPERLKVRITAAEYGETFGLASPTAYLELQAAADSILKKHIRWTTKHGRHQRATKTQWVSEATYAKGEGWLEVHFFHRLAPHLLALEKEFTTYRLAQASALRSIYAWRLLELLTMFRDTGLLKIDLGEFHHAMDTPESYRTNFAQLRRFVIEPAIKELGAKDAWLIQWKAQKHGRRVIALEFRFRVDPQGRLPLDAPTQAAARPPLALDVDAPTVTVKGKGGRWRPRSMPTEKELAAFARPGESREAAIARWLSQRDKT